MPHKLDARNRGWRDAVDRGLVIQIDDASIARVDFDVRPAHRLPCGNGRAQFHTMRETERKRPYMQRGCSRHQFADYGVPTLTV